MRLCSVFFVFAAPSLLLALSGCSNTTVQATGSGTSSGGGASSTTTGTGTGTSGTGGGSNFDAGGAVTSYTTSIGPIALDPGVEETNCITIPLNNAEGGWVRRSRADLSEGSHHMIVYTSSATTPSPTPTPCQSLGGILTGQHPVFIAQQPTATLEFPSDETNTPVGFQIAPNQMLTLEFHTINTTQAALMVTGKAYIDTIPLATTVTASDLAFWGTEQISIPAQGTFDTGVLFQAAIPGTHSFAVTTHQHHLGTEMKVWYSTGVTDTSDMVADGKDWSNPPLVMLSPALDFPAGAGKGFAYECAWNNPTSSVVNFGESFNDEMCFLWHYYYPSQGFQICADSLDGKNDFCH
jgi:hypothetical protein